MTGVLELPEASNFDNAFLQTLSETYANVKSPEFGAVGDGVTDDTAAIQAAIDEVVSRGGGTVIIPAGRYRMTATLTAPADAEVNLVGVARTASALVWDVMPDNSFGVDFGATSSTGTPQRGLYDLQLEGPGIFYGSSKGTPSNNMRALRWASKMRCERVRFKKWKVGAYCWGDHQTLLGCDWSSCHFNIYFPNGMPSAGDQHIIDCTCVSATLASIGVEAESTNFQVIRSHFGFSPFGIYIASGGSLRNIAMFGAYFEGLGNALVYGDTGSSGMNGCKFTEVRMLNAAATYLPAYPRDGWLNVDKIVECDISLDSSNYIALGGASGCVVKADLTRSRFQFTRQFIDGVLGQGAPIFKKQTGTDPIESQVHIGGDMKCRIAKAAADVAKWDLCEGYFSNQVRKYAGLVPAGVALHNTTSGDLVAVVFEGVWSVLHTGAVAVHKLLCPDLTDPGKVKQAVDFTNQPIIGQSSSAGDGTKVTCRLAYS